jgi:hypothetical protein
MICRFCNNTLTTEFIDLVNSPASNSFLTKEQLNEPETYYPLKVYVCEKCFLVQVDEYKKSNAIFDNSYAYFSSYSSTWLAHAKKYVDDMTARWGLNSESQVIEIASNDGYLLQYFIKYNIPVLGIEPTKNTAEVAILKGIPCLTDFFGVKLANELVELKRKADLLIGNNVLAHVPDIIDFVKGQKIILSDTGVITMEFPQLVKLIENNQFDTIYHEHFSYLSFTFVQKLYASVGLEIFDVEELKTHGGSLRIFAKHKEDATKEVLPSVAEKLQKEKSVGIDNIEYYNGFQRKAEKIKLDFLQFLVTQKLNNKKVAGYGAAAKGNTIINYCGIKKDLISFVVDANPAKQNKFLPASHIPVYNEAELKKQQPDYVIILPWNLRDEIIEQLSYIREWGGKFVITIPQMEIL